MQRKQFFSIRDLSTALKNKHIECVEIRKQLQAANTPVTLTTSFDEEILPRHMAETWVKQQGEELVTH